MIFVIPKNSTKSEILKKRKRYFFNIYQRDKKNFEHEKTPSSLSKLQKSVSKLVSLRIIHFNKASRIVSKYSRILSYEKESNI